MFLDWLAALADPVVKLFSTVLTNSSNERNVAATNETNRDIASQTNESQIAIHNADNAFNAEQAALNRQFQKEQSDIAYRRTTLGAKMSQALSAGVNPFLALSSGNPMAQAMSGSQAISAASPSLVAPKMEAFQAINPFQGVNLFDGLKSFAEARKLGVETKRYDLLMKLEAQEKSEQIRSLQIGNTLNHIFGFAKNKAQLELMYAQTKLASQQVLNAVEEGNFIKANTILTRWKSRTEMENSYLTGKKKELAQLDVDTYYDNLNSIIKERQASSNQSNAAASESPSRIELNQSQTKLNIANANTVDELRDYAVKKAMYEAKITFEESEHIKEKLVAEIKQTAAQAKFTEQELKRVFELTPLIKKEADWYEVKNILDELGQIFRVVLHRR